MRRAGGQSGRALTACCPDREPPRRPAARIGLPSAAMNRETIGTSKEARMKRLIVGLALAAAGVFLSSLAGNAATLPWTILLTSDREGDSEVYSVSSNGTGARRLTHTVGFDGFATWSPDRRKILYWSQNRRTGVNSGFVINADGSGKLAMWSHGSWSPDGRMIAYSDGRDGNGEIYVVNAD